MFQDNGFVGYFAYEEICGLAGGHAAVQWRVLGGFRCGMAWIIILAQASLSDAALWWLSGMPNRLHTSGSFVGWICHKRRARTMVQTNDSSGILTSASQQHAASTPLSNRALCATRNSTSLKYALSSGQSSAKLGCDFTVSHVIPCKYEK